MTKSDDVMMGGENNGCGPVSDRDKHRYITKLQRLHTSDPYLEPGALFETLNQVAGIAWLQKSAICTTFSPTKEMIQVNTGRRCGPN